MDGSAQPQWDGTRWVFWDGATWLTQATDGAWVPIAPAGASRAVAVASSVRPAPRAAEVFGQIYWRTLVVAAGGGLVIGAIVGTGVAVADASSEYVRRPGGYVLAGTFFGVFFGVFLGLVAGFLTGGLGAKRLVPYPGARASRRFSVLVALGVVAVFDLAMLAWIRPHDVGSVVVMVILCGTALVGAWLGGRWLVRWYVVRMRGLGYLDEA